MKMKGEASRVFITMDLSLLALSCSRVASRGMIKWSPFWDGEREEKRERGLLETSVLFLFI